MTLHSDILSALTEIELTWPVLLADIAAASYAGGAPSLGPKKSAGPASREASNDDGAQRHDDGTTLPGGTERISLLAEARTQLFYACCLVVDERSGQYDLGTARLDATDCISMAVWLRPHAAWIAEHLMGQETAAALQTVAAAANRLAAPGGKKRPVVGACPVAECAGVLRGHIDSDDSAIDMTYDICCDIKPEHAWAQAHWPLLGRLLEDEAEKAAIQAAKEEGRQCDVRRYPDLLDDDQLLAWLEERFKKPFAKGTIRTWRHRHGHTGLLRLEVDPGDGSITRKWDRLEVTKWRLGDASVVGS